MSLETGSFTNQRAPALTAAYTLSGSHLDTTGTLSLPGTIQFRVFPTLLSFFLFHEFTSILTFFFPSLCSLSGLSTRAYLFSLSLHSSLYLFPSKLLLQLNTKRGLLQSQRDDN